VLDSTVSPAGRRLLRQWLCRPLRSVAAISARLDAVDELLRRPSLAGAVRKALKKAGGDVERAVGRVRSKLSAPPAGLPLAQLHARNKQRLAAATAAAREVCRQGGFLCSTPFPLLLARQPHLTARSPSPPRTAGRLLLDAACSLAFSPAPPTRSQKKSRSNQTKQEACKQAFFSSILLWFGSPG